MSSLPNRSNLYKILKDSVEPSSLKPLRNVSSSPSRLQHTFNILEYSYILEGNCYFKLCEYCRHIFSFNNKTCKKIGNKIFCSGECQLTWISYNYRKKVK